MSRIGQTIIEAQERTGKPFQELTAADLQDVVENPPKEPTVPEKEDKEDK